MGLGIVVTGVIGFPTTGRGSTPTAGEDAPPPPPIAVFAGPKRLAARIYCAKAACCSGVAVLFATAVNMALNSGLVAAISVSALTVMEFTFEEEDAPAGAEVTGVGGACGVGFGVMSGLMGFTGFSVFSSTLRTERKRVSGKMCGPITTGQTPSRVVMYCDVGGGSFLPRRVGFHTLGKWYPWTQSSRDWSSAVASTPLQLTLMVDESLLTSPRRT